MDDDRIVTKDFCLATVIAFLGSMTYFVLTASVANYAIWKYGVSASEAGLAAGLFVLGGLVARIAFGRYTELLGRKRMLMVAMAIGVLAASLYFFTDTFAMLCVTRLLHGAAYGICSSTVNDIVTKMLPKNKAGEGLGYFLLSNTVSMAIGPYLALVLVGTDAYDMVFTVCMAMNILSLIIGPMLSVQEEDLTEEQKRTATKVTLRSLLHLPAVPLSVVTMLLTLAYSGVMSFIAVYSEDIGLEEAAPYFFVAFSAVTLASRFTVGKLLDRKGPNYVMIPAFLCFVAGMVMYAKATDPVTFLVPGLLTGFAISAAFPTSQTLIMRDADPTGYGSAISTYQSITDIGTGFGPMIIGALIATSGFRDAYMLCAVTAAVSLALYWIVCGRRHLRCGKNARNRRRITRRA